MVSEVGRELEKTRVIGGHSAMPNPELMRVRDLDGSYQTSDRQEKDGYGVPGSRSAAKRSANSSCL